MESKKDTSPEARDNFITHAAMLADDVHLKNAFDRYLNIVENSLEEDVDLGTIYTSNLQSTGRHTFTLRKTDRTVYGAIIEWDEAKASNAWEYEWKQEEESEREW